MTKFVGENNDGSVRLLGFGLSEENWRQLREGNPILIKGKDLRVPVPDTDVLIFGYGNEHDAVAAMEALGFNMPEDPDKIYIDPKLEG